MNTTSKQSVVATQSTTTVGTLSYSLSTTGVSAGYAMSTSSKDSSPANRHVTIKTADIESAVYAHIQALRALGITRTDTAEIAKALGLNPAAIEKTISSLTKKGVKVVHGYGAELQRGRGLRGRACSTKRLIA